MLIAGKEVDHWGRNVERQNRPPLLLEGFAVFGFPLVSEVEPKIFCALNANLVCRFVISVDIRERLLDKVFIFAALVWRLLFFLSVFLVSPAGAWVNGVGQRVVRQTLLQ